MIAVHQTDKMLIDLISKEITAAVFKRGKNSRSPQFNRQKDKLMQ